MVRLALPIALFALGAVMAMTPSRASASDGAKTPAPVSEETSDSEATSQRQLWADTPAVEMSRQPYVAIRVLRTVQDQIAHGSVSAHEEQRRLMHDLRDSLRALPPQVWDDVRNVRAAIFFVLSGGDPAVLARVIDRKHIPPIERRLLKGSLAYGEGRFVDARTLMHKMDPRKLDASLGGIVALIQGTLTAKTDPPKALTSFNEARLLAPGTLIEESALRQQLMILARNGEVEKFDLLASQYSRRFPKSLFARNFRQQFFAGVARKNFKRASEWISRTESELQKVPQPERVALYLAIAEEALKGGNIDIALYAGGRARELANAGSRTFARATLYKGAAMVATADFETGLELLGEVDLPKLSFADREIHEAALTVARSVGRVAQDAPQPGLPPPAFVAKAEELLAQVDSLLGDGP